MRSGLLSLRPLHITDPFIIEIVSGIGLSQNFLSEFITYISVGLSINPMLAKLLAIPFGILYIVSGYLVIRKEEERLHYLGVFLYLIFFSSFTYLAYFNQSNDCYCPSLKDHWNAGDGTQIMFIHKDENGKFACFRRPGFHPHYNKKLKKPSDQDLTRIVNSLKSEDYSIFDCCDLEIRKINEQKKREKSEEIENDRYQKNLKDLNNWETAKRIYTKESFKAYLVNHPEGKFVANAKRELDKLEKADLKGQTLNKNYNSNGEFDNSPKKQHESKTIEYEYIDVDIPNDRNLRFWMPSYSNNIPDLLHFALESNNHLPRYSSYKFNYTKIVNDDTLDLRILYNDYTPFFIGKAYSKPNFNGTGYELYRLEGTVYYPIGFKDYEGVWELSTINRNEYGFGEGRFTFHLIKDYTSEDKVK